MLELVPAALLLSAVPLGILCTTLAYFAIRVIKSDPQEYRETQALFGDGGFFKRLTRSIRGEASVVNGRGDYFRLHAGLAMNVKTKQYQPQGRPSKEAVRAVYESMGK